MSSLDELVRQLNPDTSASDYINAEKGLSESLTFEDMHNWTEELRTFVCEDGQSASKKKDEQSDDSEGETDPEQHYILSRGPLSLLLFLTQNNEEELAGAKLNVITQLESAQLAVKIKQSSILQYFSDA